MFRFRFAESSKTAHGLALLEATARRLEIDSAQRRAENDAAALSLLTSKERMAEEDAVWDGLDENQDRLALLKICPEHDDSVPASVENEASIETLQKEFAQLFDDAELKLAQSPSPKESSSEPPKRDVSENNSKEKVSKGGPNEGTSGSKGGTGNELEEGEIAASPEKKPTERKRLNMTGKKIDFVIRQLHSKK